MNSGDLEETTQKTKEEDEEEERKRKIEKKKLRKEAKENLIRIRIALCESREDERPLKARALRELGGAGHASWTRGRPPGSECAKEPQDHHLVAHSASLEFA